MEQGGKDMMNACMLFFERVYLRALLDFGHGMRTVESTGAMVDAMEGTLTKVSSDVGSLTAHVVAMEKQQGNSLDELTKVMALLRQDCTAFKRCSG